MRLRVGVDIMAQFQYLALTLRGPDRIIRPALGGQVARTTIALWLLAAGMSLPAPALAVDPALHSHRAFTPVLEPLVINEDDIAGLGVTEIHDLGSPRGAADAPGDLWERIRGGFALPALESPIVVERQAWYAQRPQQIKIMVERSRRYLFHIVEELEKRGMPTELALLPMVESAFNPLAYSRAHASGLWQFIPSTGRNYNLEQNWWYDARRDIVASTNAALDYLQSLHEMFGDWHLALAAYNMGENGLARAIERNRARGAGTDYAALQIPNETRRYVPSLVALKNVVANPAAFGVELDPIANAPYFVTVTLTRDIDLKLAAKLADMPLEEFLALNPGHNRPVVSSAVAPAIVLPADRAEAFVRNLDSHGKPLSSWEVYTFRKGDRLDRLAADRGVTVERLRIANGITSGSGPAVGQQLLIPRPGSTAATDPLPPVFRPPAASTGRVVSYTVRAGDTVTKVARALSATSAQVLAANGGSERLIAGRTLSIQVAAQPQRRTTQAAPSAKAAAKPAARATAKPAAPARATPPAPTQVARPSSSS
jgi:membrane-bound lytic murein transglycosylase D